MDTHIEFCIRFWEATRELDLYSMDGSQLDRLIVDALLKTNGGKELKKTSMNELSVLIRAINHNNRKIQSALPSSNLDEAAEKYSENILANNEDLQDAIEDAYKAGWRDKERSDKQPEVDLKMVVRIDNIVMTMLGEGYNDGYKTRPFYEEVLKRFNEQRKK